MNNIYLPWAAVPIFLFLLAWPMSLAAIDWNISGQIRQEIAYSIAGNANDNNLFGSDFNHRITPHYTHPGWGTGANAAATTSTFVNERGVAGYLQQTALMTAGITPSAGQRDLRTVAAGSNTSASANCRFGHLNAIRAGSTGLVGNGGFRGVLCPNGAGSGFVPGAIARRNGGISPQGAGLSDELNFNLFSTRLELDVQARITDNFSGFLKFRAYVDSTARFTDGRLGNRFENPYWGTASTLAEYAAPSMVFDIPAFYFDYDIGPVWLRIGNQTIAWGEAYFFRVMDVANGLDLRRHLTLGPGGEEFQDQRIASPTLRVSYSLGNDWEVDAFASMFSPTVLPPQNTAYSLIAHGTTLDERDEFDDAKGAINYGLRVTMPLTGQLTVNLMYANRRNPEGIFRYAEAPRAHAGLTNGFCVGAQNETNRFLADAPGGPLQGAVVASGLDAMPTVLGRGHQRLNHCGSPVAPDPYASTSTEYWHVIGQTRLDPMQALRTAINEWPATQWSARQIFGFGDEQNVADALRTLETFHSLLGGFRPWATREFKRENIFAASANYLISTADPESFFDSMIIRGEIAVTPDKQFTDLGLSADFIEETEIVSALIIEKFHRFSDSFPATYLVWQWMHREASDLFGRHLSGTESVALSEFIDPVTGDFTPAAFVDNAASPRGSSAADYVVFAFQQPSRSLLWRLDLALLIDVEGGYLVQPGIRYRPSDRWQWDLYANVMEGGGDKNDDIMESLDFADEIFVRFTHYF